MTTTTTSLPTGRYGYYAPTTLAVALDLVADGEHTVIGGGTLVYPRLAREVPVPRRLVDLARLPGIDRVTRDRHGTTTIGAGVTYGGLARSSDTPPLLRMLAAGITGGPQIRDQGTVGGSACYANPSSDVPGALVALDAVVVLADVARERRLPARQFFRGPFATALGVGEVVLGFEVPSSATTDAWGYTKLKHGGSGWPVATASARVARTRDGSPPSVRVTVGAVAAVPVAVEFATAPDRAELQDAIDAARPDWWSDEQGDATYRRRVAGAIAARALTRALDGESS